jgi:hypothetical protein
VRTQRDGKEEDIRYVAIEPQPSCLLQITNPLLITARATTSLTCALDPASQTLSSTIRRAAPASPDCRRLFEIRENPASLDMDYFSPWYVSDVLKAGQQVANNHHRRSRRSHDPHHPRKRLAAMSLVRRATSTLPSTLSRGRENTHAP